METAVVLVVLISIAVVGNLKFAVAVSLAVPVLYAVITKVVDFLIRWELKGRRSRGEYRIWMEAERDWEFHTGDVERLVALHENGGKVAYIEESVRFSKANPYSLGLDLTAGAIAVDVASLIGGEGATTYLGYAVLLHFLLLMGAIVILVSNQNAPPYDVIWLRLTATAAILVGVVAMGSSFLALDAGLVSELLNTRGSP